jgi:hypothetical protein
MSTAVRDLDDILIDDFCTDYDHEHFTRGGLILIAHVRLVVACSKSNLTSVREYNLELLEEIRKAIEAQTDGVT